jgi:hypothetical protein
MDAEVSPFPSPELNAGIFDVKLQAEEARPLPAGIQTYVFVLIADKRET